MTYNHAVHNRFADVCEHIDTVEEFLTEYAKVNAEMNEAWAKVKDRIPEEDRVAAETKVRVVLPA